MSGINRKPPYIHIRNDFVKMPKFKNIVSLAKEYETLGFSFKVRRAGDVILIC